MDSFSPMGGEDVLQRCMNLTNNAQNLNFTGWKAFDDSRNRFAIINDYLDGAMQPFRQLQYDYYRTGLGELANIYKGHGTTKEKESVYEILFGINASQNATWDKIKE